MQVLITNPSLVETGLDLNAFTTLVFYSMGYKLFTAAAGVAPELAHQPESARSQGLYALLRGHHAAEMPEAHGLEAGGRRTH